MQEENSKTLRHKSLGYGLDGMVEQVDYAMSFGGGRKVRLRRREEKGNILSALGSRDEASGRGFMLCNLRASLTVRKEAWLHDVAKLLAGIRACRFTRIHKNRASTSCGVSHVSCGSLFIISGINAPVHDFENRVAIVKTLVAH